MKENNEGFLLLYKTGHPNDSLSSHDASVDRIPVSNSLFMVSEAACQASYVSSVTDAALTVQPHLASMHST